MKLGFLGILFPNQVTPVFLFVEISGFVTKLFCDKPVNHLKNKMIFATNDRK